MARHVHADLMIEAANDTSIKWQWCRNEADYYDCPGRNPDWSADLKYRKKPREFQVGHWYPAIDKGGDNAIYFFNGGVFQVFEDTLDGNQSTFKEGSLKWIGESLGKLKFG